MSRPVVIAAGGTGGHMFPALALAAELERRGQAVILACDRRGSRYLPAGMNARVIRAASPSGSMGDRLRGTAELALGFAQSLAFLRRRGPAAVAAFGGYASVPVGLAAQALRIPTLVHEQNAVLGRANRLIARRAQRVALTFAATRGAEAVPEARRLVAGNPIRAVVAALRDRPYRLPASAEPFRLLVVGGSQGARVLSDVLPAAMAHLSARIRTRIALTQQCRPEDLDRVARAYAELGYQAELRAFFDDLPARLADAHMVISRSGASSVAELLALGRPALLVPFRLAADDHQRANAEAVAAAGAGALIGEAELDAALLADRITAWVERPEQLAEMAARAKQLGRPDAAQALADALDGLARRPAGLHLEALA
jgi:UDP-N-acetylglucosamine--N-acetylmuramyl-(pentapeptide) pyrophosphoryl-undecaprenol N-acetylglucosamine transferase